MTDKIEHRDIRDPDIHEMKGLSGAAANTVYVADGLGSGAWTSVSGLASTVKAVVAGEADNGDALPLPGGYTLSQCRYIVSPKYPSAACYARVTANGIIQCDGGEVLYLVVGVG